MTSFVIKIIDGEKSVMFHDNANGYPSWIFEVFDYKKCRTIEGAIEMCRNCYTRINDKNDYWFDYYYELSIKQKRIDVFDREGNFIHSYQCKNI